MSTWIPISERLPTREDADERSDVVWKWTHGGTSAARFNLRPEDAVAWLPLPRYTPPKPGPTNAECEILHAGMAEAVADGERTEPIIRRWFANVMARIEREKGK